MQPPRILASFVGAAVYFAAASTAFAATPVYKAEARLVTPVSAPKEAAIDRFQWKCADDLCQAASDERPKGNSFMRECRNVAAVLGPLQSYASRGRTMSPGNVKACNRAATSGETALTQR